MAKLPPPETGGLGVYSGLPNYEEAASGKYTLEQERRCQLGASSLGREQHEHVVRR